MPKKTPRRKVYVDGRAYTPAVLLVTDRDHLGRPLAGRFVHEEQTVDLKEARADVKPVEFIIVFADKATWGAPPRDS